MEQIYAVNEKIHSLHHNDRSDREKEIEWRRKNTNKPAMQASIFDG
ncbi:hypothetical protein ADIARSV_4154 [Arcticibacter svalbardensis MN12-7]|uniref:Uncharacterized protein n=1 Tax=Arcticibacter svalbardensis MN12-7 TaxID=1150600 RepID=R9GLF1_9SPHI|nr:hypothetical protein [Arcticibacter svalbardensis]EOR92642.1 hypothetical protein ADIARSV_4154 [Arcticibacter svalbardensis MN12-7]